MLSFAASVSVLLLASSFLTVDASPTGSPIHIFTRTKLRRSGIANVHIRDELPNARSKALVVTYGDCAHTSASQAYHQIGEVSPRPEDDRTDLKRRLVWLISDDAEPGGCISAWDKDTAELLGRSETLDIETEARNKRGVGISMGPENGIDVDGPWFDGVEHLKGIHLKEVQVEKAKETRIGIVGAGMSGLMYGLLLDSVGIRNWHILEASERIGGRVRTVYLNGTPDDYQYQEMGPMRFPVSITYPQFNATFPVNDHKLVFQTADYLNRLNHHSPEYAVNFIPWIQNNVKVPVYECGIRKPDGTVPRQEDIDKDPSLKCVQDLGPMAGEVNYFQGIINNTFYQPAEIAALALNMYETHKKFIDEGYDDWSETAWIHNYLHASLNTTDIIGGGDESFWLSIFDATYFLATTWRTIGKGLNRLPHAFTPLVKDRVSFSRHVTKVSFDEQSSQVTLAWKKNITDRTTHNEIFDYAVVAAPFSMVRKWRFYPQPSSIKIRAINNLQYESACKVALHFKTRFWEKGANPIYGGCTATDIPGIGGFCFPSYKLGSDLPGVLLASYSVAESSLRMLSMSEAEHADYVLSAMEEIFGGVVREQYTGLYNRQCWVLDEYTSASWANPSVGQHKLYIPSYFRTEQNTIFIGEHTSYTHGWIAAALESAVRGTVQLLLGLGLVDEAKQITTEWMGRWIKL